MSSPTSRRRRRSSSTAARRSSRCSPRWRSGGSTPTHVLRTHAHGDHVAHEAELSLPVVTGGLRTGDLQIEAIPTPGHSDDMVCFVVNGELVFSGDSLFKDAVGGGDFAAIKHVRDGRLHGDAARARASCPATRTRRRSAASGTRTRSCGCGAGPSPRERARAASAAATPARRLVAGLRRQGQGVGPLRGRPRRYRRRLPRRAGPTPPRPFNVRSAESPYFQARTHFVAMSAIQYRISFDVRAI